MLESGHYRHLKSNQLYSQYMLDSEMFQICYQEPAGKKGWGSPWYNQFTATFQVVKIVLINSTHTWANGSGCTVKSIFFISQSLHWVFYSLLFFCLTSCLLNLEWLSTNIDLVCTFRRAQWREGTAMLLEHSWLVYTTTLTRVAAINCGWCGAAETWHWHTPQVEPHKATTEYMWTIVALHTPWLGN